LVDTGPFPTTSALLYRAIIALTVLIATGIAIMHTIHDMPSVQSENIARLQILTQMVLLLDLGIQTLAAMNMPRDGEDKFAALRRYILSAYGIIDLLAAMPLLFTVTWGDIGDWEAVAAIVQFLKLARFSPALETLVAVAHREARPLQSATFILVLMLLVSSTALYFVERDTNTNFASIPQSMWWSVATLTTVGYGDAVPTSGLGKLLGGVVAMLGIAMFALPASILATGFAEEMRRRDFLATWQMVARVPFFAKLEADQIAEITKLLRYHVVPIGEVVVRAGELGDRMYFIVSGLLAVNYGSDEPALLSDGDFFGEIALLHDTRRTATVTARSRSQLLILDAADLRRFLKKSPEIGKMVAAAAKQRLKEQAN
jgi:voltage-gated potassium channel